MRTCFADVDVVTYEAFTNIRGGGNPAGVVLDAHGASDAEMAALASDLGHSETVFVERMDGDIAIVRYFAPRSEVPFCGHATIALLIALSDAGLPLPRQFRCRAGLIDVGVERDRSRRSAHFTTVPATSTPATADLVGATCELLGWNPSSLEPTRPAIIGDAGARHLFVFARTLGMLDAASYDLSQGSALMIEADVITIGLVSPLVGQRCTVRHLFARGGIAEDPATGAGAAALAHVLVERGELGTDQWLEIDQGGYLGRPSKLWSQQVDDRRVLVKGGAVRVR